MTNEKEPDLDTWDDFSGKFLKADLIKSWPACFIPIIVRSHYDEEENSHVIYTGEIEGKKKDWEPNKTNLQLMKTFGVKSPKDAIGKKIFFKRVENRNPTTHLKVASVEIEKIE